MYKRKLEQRLLNSLKPDFVVVLYGARRTGKTVLMNAIRDKIAAKSKILMVNGEDLEVAEILASQKLSTLERFTRGYDYLFIDEAQAIPHVAKSLKLMVDSIDGLHIFITGSSALELKNNFGEPLTGRSKFFYLLPFSQSELEEDFLQMKNHLEDKLIYGCYPQVINSEASNDKVDILQSIKNGYLLKDILVLDNLKDSLFVMDLLRLIAFQVGHDISYSELAKNLKVNVRTVMRYLDILEKTFIIFTLKGFSRNLRKEISKSPRIYFWDNGIRNTVISNYNSIKLRNDTGQLWENYIMVERMKFKHYNELYMNNYFWRTYDQQEIDLIEEYSGKLFAYEFKWNTESRTKIPKAFAASYSDADFNVIHPENYYEFIGV
jgi:predicted AAA+ superfamily ATPase